MAGPPGTRFLRTGRKLALSGAEAGGELAAREVSRTRAAEQVAVVSPETGYHFDFLDTRRDAR
ncbi:hypothetical protein GCM10010193_57080 [Kitasatospora atroaurantiaca]